ncbi:Mu transposase C-terminal domain-containing protein [Paraburkholderia megapolitana]|uniref:Mu transposase, C-terminal n=1 Tax=Paraburkholderia megapolitana TaxID=420953 RepID=A0A1I3JKM5_9BURK|nr:Mu transposase C-terminal domain-containing protein [Paraburkholderia megapolitana]SFI60425.1 Mu transposase, C-terminal [Paraburkholderia megapolitana]
MLSDTELQELFDRLDTPEAGRKRVKWIRENAPVRTVGGGKRSNIVRYASRKMGFVIECEARSTEYAAAVTWDFDDETLEFYSQPSTLTLRKRLPNDRRSTYTYTPDFFRITNSGFEFIECKTEQDLLVLAIKSPHTYSVDESKSWRCAPGEESAAEFGVMFRVRSTNDNNPVLIENIEFLRDYLVAEPQTDVGQQCALREYLTDRPWATAAAILGAIPNIADTLYAEIAKGRVTFDLVNERIADTERALVFRDKQSASAYRTFAQSRISEPRGNVILELLPGTRFDWDGKPWEVINRGDTLIACRCLDPGAQGGTEFIDLESTLVDALAKEGKIIPYAKPVDGKEDCLEWLERASDDQLARALERYKALFAVNYSGPLTTSATRTRQYWLASFRRAQRFKGYGFVGLIPNWEHTQGNRQRRIDPPVVSIMADIFHRDWTDPRQKSNTAMFGEVINRCEAIGLTAPSRKTFLREIRILKNSDAAVKRFGSRVAYEMEPILLADWLDYTTPRHGTHPFHIAHLDHTPLPIRLVSRSNRKLLKSVWLSLMVCAYSRKILAYYLTFDPPSYRSNMMIIRDCVRRHGRVPQFVVVDNGKDFQSGYFDRLLAALNRNKLHRRPGRPRDGGVIESLFNVTQETFIFNLLGNTQADREFRKKTKSVAPERLAIWTYERFNMRLEQYFNNVYHENYHSTLGCSPNEMFNRGLDISGQREHTRIPYSKAFLMLTFPSTPKGTAKITVRGIKVNYLYYTSPVLRIFRSIGQHVPVRYDPFNMGVAYAYVDNRWHECHSEHYLTFRGRSEKEMQIASEFLRGKARQAGIEAPLNAKRLAEFLNTTAADEVLDMQRLYEEESESGRPVDDGVITEVTEGSVWSDAEAVDEPELHVYKPQLLGDF